MAKKRTDGDHPHPLDIALGAHVRTLRKEAGLSQDELAKQINITFQQIQKYEHGTNRISFSRLCEIAGVLNMSAHDVIGELGNAANGRKSNNIKTANAVVALAQPLVTELVEAFQKIGNRNKQRAILNMVRQMSGNGK